MCMYLCTDISFDTPYIHDCHSVCMSVNHSFGTTGTQITQCRAYKYYYNNASPVSTCFRVYKNQ